MGQAIGDVLPLAIGVAISPVPVIAIILILGTLRARTTGLAFTLGWLGGLTIAGAIMLVIAQAGISGGPEAVALVVFILVGSLTILAPLGIYLTLGAEAKRILGGMKAWMAFYNAAIMAVLLLVLGAKLTGDGIGGLSA